MAQIVERVERVLNEKIVQVSIISGILFYIVAHPELFAFVEGVVKQLASIANITVNLKGGNLLIFHSVVFAVLIGITIKYIFEPLFHANNGLFK